MRLIIWVFRALIFFILFAFALHNQHPATIKWAFGYEWQSQTVFVVLAAFAMGCGVGMVAMLPSWWRHRKQPKQDTTAPSLTPPRNPPERSTEHPPRDGL